MKTNNNDSRGELTKTLIIAELEALDMTEVKGGKGDVVIPIQYKCNNCTATPVVQ